VPGRTRKSLRFHLDLVRKEGAEKLWVKPGRDNLRREVGNDTVGQSGDEHGEKKDPGREMGQLSTKEKKGEVLLSRQMMHVLHKKGRNGKIFFWAKRESTAS